MALHDPACASQIMKLNSKSFKSACRSAISRAGNSKSRIRDLLAAFEIVADAVPTVTSAEAEILTEVVWSPEFTPPGFENAGVHLSDALKEMIPLRDLDLSDPEERELFCTVVALDLKLRLLDDESGFLLYVLVWLMQHAPDGADVRDFLIVEDHEE